MLKHSNIHLEIIASRENHEIKHFHVRVHKAESYEDICQLIEFLYWVLLHSGK